MNDEDFIRKTLKLAKKGIGWTNPNPMVGALIVKDEHIIARGYHRKKGFPHAEIEAIQHARESLQGTTLYVNFEPCAHFGKTPPCVDEIIRSRIKRVVCCSLDPNPKVKGQGIAKLKKAGVDVIVGVLEREARLLNEAFFTFHEKKRPFIAIKFAASLDGKIATRTGDSKWITNEKARTFAKMLRNEYQAVLVGINTVLKDDPHLGNSLRVILDSKLKIPLKAQVLRDTNVIVATSQNANEKKEKLLKNMSITIFKFNGDQVPLKSLLKKLYEKEIISIFVEGGATVLKSFIDEKLFDKVYAFYAPILLGEAQNMQEASLLKNITFRRFDDNILINGY